jgi:hypothetical protein
MLNPIDLGFTHIGCWYLDVLGEASFDLPSRLRGTPGLILLEAGAPLLVASTNHFGPRVGDFIHSRSGETPNARIHRNITDLLKKDREISLWVLEGQTARGRRSEVIAELKPIWNLR